MATKRGQNPKGGLNAKGVASYRKQNPGSKLKMAVTTKPSKLKPGSKDAKRRKSFCARMGGMPGPMKDKKVDQHVRHWLLENGIVNNLNK